MSAIHTVVERRMVYVYGPNGQDFEGVVSGPYTGEQLHAQVRDKRWGPPMTWFGCRSGK